MQPLAELLALCESPIEVILARKMYKLKVDFKPAVDIGPYRVDFLVESKDGRKIVIECDGKEWHKDKAKDAKRQRNLEKLGYIVLRFTGTEINANPHGCATQVLLASQPKNYLELRVFESGQIDRVIHSETAETQKRLEALKVAVEVG